jgi:Flp pilus assembly protein TadD
LDSALEHSKKSIELSPDNGQFFDTLAEVYLARGDKAEALRQMHKAVELLPEDPRLAEHLKEMERE